MPLSLREVLDLDAVRRGEPQVVAGAGGLDVPVRWVHAAELPDVGRLLRGGELLLSTGIALPPEPAALAEYISSLAAAGVAGLAVELGRRYTSALPAALVAAAGEHGLPLVELRREVAFVEITEAVHARILDELLIARAAATLALGRLLTSQHESLERQAHRTLISAIIERTAASSGAGSGEAAARARAMGVEVTGRELVAVVARLPDGPPAPGAPVSVATVPVLAVAEAMAGASRAAGVPALVGALDDVRVGALLSLPPDTDADKPLRAIAQRAQSVRLGPAPPATESLATESLASGPVTMDSNAPRVVLGASAPARSLGEVRAAFQEAREVADLAANRPGTATFDIREGDMRAGAAAGRLYYRLPDLRLRGVVHLLRDDPRLRSFARRELGPLLAYDAEHGTSLLADLTAFLESGGNKAMAAARAHVARPTFYQRLRLIERVLGVSVTDPESRVSLHLALLALASPD
jgi:PucR family transcriptional regulator, purine catabolism regulatory protein